MSKIRPIRRRQQKAEVAQIIDQVEVGDVIQNLVANLGTSLNKREHNRFMQRNTSAD